MHSCICIVLQCIWERNCSTKFPRLCALTSCTCNPPSPDALFCCVYLFCFVTFYFLIHFKSWSEILINNEKTDASPFVKPIVTMDICFFEFSANIYRLTSRNCVFSDAPYNRTNYQWRSLQHDNYQWRPLQHSIAISGAPYNTTISRKLKEEIDKELDLAIEESNTKVRCTTCLNRNISASLIHTLGPTCNDFGYNEHSAINCRAIKDKHEWLKFIQWRVHRTTYRPVVRTFLRLRVKYSLEKLVLYNRVMNSNELGNDLEVRWPSPWVQWHCSVWPWHSILWLWALGILMSRYQTWCLDINEQFSSEETQVIDINVKKVRLQTSTA